MRVLHLNDRLSQRGGADIHLLGILDAQKDRHDVHLAVGRDDGTATTAAPVHLLDGVAARDAQPVPRLASLLETLRPDLVHVHNVMNPLALASLRGVPTVMTVQDHRGFCPGRGKLTRAGAVCTQTQSRDACADCFDDTGYFEDIFALTKARLDAFRDLPLIVLSEYMRRELQAMGAKRVEVIPPFVYDLDPDAEADGDPCVLFVGRLVPAKGVPQAIEAWRAAATDLPLVLGGSGSLRAQAEEAGCTVTGWLDRVALSRLYRRARVLLLPSMWQEPFGIVGLEALAFGVPVAAFDSGGIREWHAGDGLVPWGDVAALGAAAARLAGTRASSPPGFERNALMARLDELYQQIWKTWSSTRAS